MKQKEAKINWIKIKNLCSLSRAKKSIIKINNNWLLIKITIHQVKNS
jgi:hypothetical protein